MVRDFDRVSRGETFRAIRGPLLKIAIPAAIIGGLVWWNNQTDALSPFVGFSTFDPLHFSLHDLANNHYRTGFNPDLILDNVSGSQLTHGQHVTISMQTGLSNIPVTGTEYMVHDTSAGSDKVLDIIIPDNTKLSNYVFDSNKIYDLQGQMNLQAVGFENGKEIFNPLLDVDKISVDASSSTLPTPVAIGGLGLLGAGLATMPRKISAAK